MEITKKVLIIEDDPNIRELLKIHLSDIGCEVSIAEDGHAGWQKASGGDFTLIILDIMLPKMDGMEVCRRIRDTDKITPILMLTAKSEELDKVLGLELGADDYLTKPFSIRELIARVKAIFRRMESLRESEKSEKPVGLLEFGPLRIDFEKRKVRLRGETLELTAKEFDLLRLFSQNAGRAYSRQELLDIVWGYQFDGYDHTVNSHINRLRGKIEKDPADPRFIKTVWGVGYRFCEREEVEE